MSWIITGTQRYQPAALLDQFPGAAAAYSLRNLVGTSNPSVVRVRRDNDNAEQDFTATEVSDGTLSTWVGVGNDGFARTWYDQSGNGNDATQATAASQPKIVQSGSVLTNNGINCFQSFGSNDSLLVTGLNISNFTIFGVLSAAGSSAAWEIYNGANRRIMSPGGGYGFWQNGNFFNYSAPDLVELHTALYVNGSVEIFYNGTSAGSANYIPITNSDKLILLNDSTLGNENSRLAELILYPSDQSTNRAAIEANINAHYSIYP